MDKTRIKILLLVAFFLIFLSSLTTFLMQLTKNGCSKQLGGNFCVHKNVTIIHNSCDVDQSDYCLRGTYIVSIDKISYCTVADSTFHAEYDDEEHNKFILDTFKENTHHLMAVSESTCKSIESVNNIGYDILTIYLCIIFTGSVLIIFLYKLVKQLELDELKTHIDKINSSSGYKMIYYSSVDKQEF